MRAPLVYLDTSALGGYYDDEFSSATRRLFDEMVAGRIRAMISDIVGYELKLAPERVRRLVEGTSGIEFEVAVETVESVELADQYIEAGIVSAKYRDDCRHVALASVTGVDLLVSWNFRHIVQYDKIRKFNAVNMLRGYPTLEIRSPLEVIYHE